MKQGLETSFALLLAAFLFFFALGNAYIYIYLEMQKNFLRRDSSKSHL